MSVSRETVPVQVTLRGEVGGGEGEYAREKVEQALAAVRASVLHAHVVLDRRRDPALAHPARAEATVDVGGTTVRVHAFAPNMTEAADELETRLRRRLVQLEDRTRTRHRWTGVAAEHEWRHGDLPRRPVPYFPRPEESREVVRHKSLAPAPMTVDEAAFEMDLLDHDFYLFTDLDSGQPALVHRLADGGYGVQGAAGAEAVASVTQEPPPPALTDSEARTRLEADGEPFVFYVDADSAQGRVLYRRYDGHYGLIAADG